MVYDKAVIREKAKGFHRILNADGPLYIGKKRSTWLSQTGLSNKLLKNTKLSSTEFSSFEHRIDVRPLSLKYIIRSIRRVFSVIV